MSRADVAQAWSAAETRDIQLRAGTEFPEELAKAMFIKSREFVTAPGKTTFNNNALKDLERFEKKIELIN